MEVSVSGPQGWAPPQLRLCCGQGGNGGGGSPTQGGSQGFHGVGSCSLLQGTLLAHCCYLKPLTEGQQDPTPTPIRKAVGRGNTFRSPLCDHRLLLQRTRSLSRITSTEAKHSLCTGNSIKTCQTLQTPSHNQLKNIHRVHSICRL